MIDRSKNKKPSLPKIPSGIEGLDEIMDGGFPKGRPILVCGSAGCGKSLMGMQFLIKGVLDHDENGVLMTFEETAYDVIKNVRSLGFDAEKLIKDKRLKIDHVRVERSEIEETGEYDLEGLFVRLNYAIDSIGAKRVVLDTIESLFGGIDNDALLRSEIRRLFHWLKEKGVTAIITGERGEKSLTRQGLEEYVSDCVILLDFRVNEQIATRRLRIVKYRGSTHGTNEYPFLINDNGITVLPITSLKLDHKASTKVFSTGLSFLDKQFHNGGIFQGNGILITGAAGSAKTILAATLAAASCERGEVTLYFSFEESPDQMVKNMESIGLPFKKYVKSGMLTIHASRPTLYGLEMHLLELSKSIKDLNPKTVIIDPISSLITIGNKSEVHAMLVRLMDLLKVNGINGVFTSLTGKRGIDRDTTEEAVSSLADTWIRLRNVEAGNMITKQMRIIKSRGAGHTGNVLDYIITSRGIQFLDESSEPQQINKTASVKKLPAKKGKGSKTPARKATAKNKANK